MLYSNVKLKVQVLIFEIWIRECFIEVFIDNQSIIVTVLNDSKQIGNLTNLQPQFYDNLKKYCFCFNVNSKSEKVW